MTSVGTYRYMSPERLRGDKYDGTADIWSVGITIVELWNKKYPFSHVADTPISLLGELENLDFPRFLSRIGDFSRPMTEFLLGLLDVEPSQRITSERLMGNEWFEKNDVRCLVDAHAVSKVLPSLLTISTWMICWEYSTYTYLRIKMVISFL